MAEAWAGSQMTEVARLRGSRVGDEGVGAARTGERNRVSSDARVFASGRWLHWRERAGREVGSTALLLREEAAAPRGDRVTRIGGWWENSTLPVRPLRSSTVVRKDDGRVRDDGGSEARSSCPEGWLTLQKLRSSRRSSSEG